MPRPSLAAVAALTMFACAPGHAEAPPPEWMASRLRAIDAII